MNELFEQFLKEKEFLQGVSPRTIKYFRFCWMSWSRLAGHTALPTKATCNKYIIALRESRISISTINSYLRGLNSFLTWLHENEHTPERLRMKPLREPERVLKTLSNEQIRLLLSYRPKTFYQHRVYAMVCVALDTGARVDELITLRRDKVELQNLFITVRGKGNKERVIPISLECRKVLYKFLSKHDFDFVFPTRHGGKVYYRSALDQLKKMCAAVKVRPVSWHCLRHSFASAYIRDGGNAFYLQRLLGHSDIATTQIYVSSQLEHLQLVHRKTSLLERLH